MAVASRRAKLSERLTVRLPYALLVQLRQAVDRRHLSAFIRRALEEALDRHTDDTTETR